MSCPLHPLAAAARNHLLQSRYIAKGYPMNDREQPRRTRSQIVEASRRRRIARWRAMCNSIENPLAKDAHPESARLYRELIEATGGESQLSPQQLVLIQR